MLEKETNGHHLINVNGLRGKKIQFNISFKFKLVI